MEITHTRKSALRPSHTFFFNVSPEGVITRIFENGHTEVVTKNETLEKLTPLPSANNLLLEDVEINCEKVEIEDLESSVDIEWVLKPIKKQLKELLTNNPAIILTGVKIEYETIPQVHHINIEL